MIVFIDDSGDPGFKIEKGSSTHFTIAMVCFDDDLEAEKTAVAIKELKRKLKLKDINLVTFAIAYQTKSKIWQFILWDFP